MKPNIPKGEAGVADDIIPNCVKRDWVNCPICGEPDMRREEDCDGNALILCVNHACGSNGGTNYDAVPRKLTLQSTLDLQAINRIIADQTKTIKSENLRLTHTLQKIAIGSNLPITHDHPEALMRCEIHDLARSALHPTHSLGDGLKG